MSSQRETDNSHTPDSRLNNCTTPLAASTFCDDFDSSDSKASSQADWQSPKQPVAKPGHSSRNKNSNASTAFQSTLFTVPSRRTKQNSQNNGPSQKPPTFETPRAVNSRAQGDRHQVVSPFANRSLDFSTPLGSNPRRRPIVTPFTNEQSLGTQHWRSGLSPFDTPNQKSHQVSTPTGTSPLELPKSSRQYSLSDSPIFQSASQQSRGTKRSIASPFSKPSEIPSKRQVVSPIVSHSQSSQGLTAHNGFGKTTPRGLLFSGSSPKSVDMKKVHFSERTALDTSEYMLPTLKATNKPAPFWTPSATVPESKRKRRVYKVNGLFNLLKLNIPRFHYKNDVERKRIRRLVQLSKQGLFPVLTNPLPTWHLFTILKAVKMNDKCWMVWLDKDPQLVGNKQDEDEEQVDIVPDKNSVGFTVMLINSGNNVLPVNLTGIHDNEKQQTSARWQDDDDIDETSRGRLNILEEALQNGGKADKATRIRLEQSTNTDLGSIKAYFRWDVDLT